jgi:hypothetical protein
MLGLNLLVTTISSPACFLTSPIDLTIRLHNLTVGVINYKQKSPQLVASGF